MRDEEVVKLHQRDEADQAIGGVGANLPKERFSCPGSKPSLDAAPMAQRASRPTVSASGQALQAEPELFRHSKARDAWGMASLGRNVSLGDQQGRCVEATMMATWTSLWAM